MLHINDMDETRFPTALLRTIGFVEALAMDGKVGSARIVFEGRSEFTHSEGTTVQGGIITAWLDNAMAWAVIARSPKVILASMEIKVSFLSRVGQGRHVVDARVVKWGRSVVFLEAQLLSEDGKLLATASSTGMLRHDA
jgi:uncharacterized protein (TIGR00369 family)